MRIIAGKYRHRLISYPENNPHIRPTKDRVREAIFSSIGDIDGKIVLDLYAGSGSMGLEALSRDASFAYFNDHSMESINAIKKNVMDLAIENDKCKISFSEDIKFLELAKEQSLKFDLVFLDPPYQEGKYEEILYILSNDLLNKNAIIVMESSREIKLDSSKYSKVKYHKYGDIYVTTIYK